MPRHPLCNGLSDCARLILREVMEPLANIGRFGIGQLFPIRGCRPRRDQNPGLGMQQQLANSCLPQPGHVASLFFVEALLGFVWAQRFG